MIIFIQRIQLLFRSEIKNVYFRIFFVKPTTRLGLDIFVNSVSVYEFVLRYALYYVKMVYLCLVIYYEITSIFKKRYF